MKTLRVQLADESYDIHVEGGLLNDLGRLIAGTGLSGKAALVTNPTVAALYRDAAVNSIEASGFPVTVIEIPDGEEFKNSATLSAVYDALIDGGLDRRSFIVALGGGVVGDLAGFAAATYLRGIPFVQVPTTLLAQVDSSVGGKTAIDHPRGKNLIGSFYQPRLVVADTETLKTLPEREFRAGLAEVVKYGAVLDADFFRFLEENYPAVMAQNSTVLQQLILRCCQLKALVVEEDERESGLRAVLNYGHTLGHAFETAAGYGSLVHGEAVAIGMSLAARISKNLGHCGEEDVARIEGLLTRFGLLLTPPQIGRRQLLDALSTDKKIAGAEIGFVCNRGIGGHMFVKLSAERLLDLCGVEVAA